MTTQESCRPIIMTLCIAMAVFSCAVSRGESPAGKRIGIDDARLLLSPYSWKRTGEGESLRAEAAMPGAYLKAAWTNSATIGVLVDGTANQHCPDEALPVVEYSVDGREYHTARLQKRDGVYVLPLAKDLDPKVQHNLEFLFRASSLGTDRWGASTGHVRVAGIELDKGGSLAPCQARPKRAIGFGDSITEGVCAEGLCPYYSNLMMNNARVTWFPLVCGALDCEYGQLGSGGLGLMKPMSLPPLVESWDRPDAAASRLTDGRLLPEPDYIFSCIGTNDFEGAAPNIKHFDIRATYEKWLTALRKACPNSRIFCVTPPMGMHRDEIAAAVSARNQAGDARVYLIDTTPLTPGYNRGSSQYADDGCHPSVYGNAVLGAFVAVEAQKILDRTQ
jgi:hypothetical protein